MEAIFNVVETRAPRGFHDVDVIVFEKNRGYGAAINEGWRRV
jgi:hypothetical protein